MQCAQPPRERWKRVPSSLPLEEVGEDGGEALLWTRGCQTRRHPWRSLGRLHQFDQTSDFRNSEKELSQGEGEAECRQVSRCHLEDSLIYASGLYCLYREHVTDKQEKPCSLLGFNSAAFRMGGGSVPHLLPVAVRGLTPVPDALLLGVNYSDLDGKIVSSQGERGQGSLTSDEIQMFPSHTGGRETWPVLQGRQDSASQASHQPRRVQRQNCLSVTSRVFLTPAP